ncbi:MAG: thiamine-phosphate kinase [Gammaproteobacteria bacterium]
MYADQADALLSDDRLGGPCGPNQALFAPPPGHELVMTVDTLVSGVHFPQNSDPADVGHKALAVNLSDLAAAGADASWVTVTVSGATGEQDGQWLAGFRSGLQTLARRWEVTVRAAWVDRGPSLVSIGAYGVVPAGQALRRSGAAVGDDIYVTGSLGDAGLALEYHFARRSLPAVHEGYLTRRLRRPEPRLDVGRALRGLARAAIDISDGLAADLGHILAASGVGATVHLERLPLSPSLREAGAREAGLRLALTAGDDYELCFTAPPEKEAQLQGIAAQTGVAITRIGEIEAQRGLRIVDAAGVRYRLPKPGYEHFRS